MPGISTGGSGLASGRTMEAHEMMECAVVGLPEPTASGWGKSTPESRGWAVGEFPGCAESLIPRFTQRLVSTSTHRLSTSSDTRWLIKPWNRGSGTSAPIPREWGAPGVRANQQLQLGGWLLQGGCAGFGRETHRAATLRKPYPPMVWAPSAGTPCPRKPLTS